jgi:2-oxoglutarate ferredoxin oxidoreductase subunit beta
MNHHGFAFINVISPCVTFNNNLGSTKSYDYVRQHIEATSTIDFVPMMKEIKVDYNQGDVADVAMHDGSLIKLKKLAKDWDPQSSQSAMNAIINAKSRGEILTGLLYIDEKSKDLHDLIHTSELPLNTLTEKELCPGNEALKSINDGFR